MRNITGLAVSFFLSFFIAKANGNGIIPQAPSSGTDGFIKNKGQIVDQNNKPNPNVKYLLCSPGFNVQLRQTGFSYDTYTEKKDTTYKKPNLPSHKFKNRFPDHFIRYYHRVDVELLGCNPDAKIIPIGMSSAYYNYFTTGTPAGGVKDVHYYQKVVYKNIYPNIDLVASLNLSKGETSNSSTKTSRGGFEYSFVIHPGGNPSEIKLQYKGATKIILKNGQLSIKVNPGTFTENIPAGYLQNTNQNIKVTYVSLGNNTFGFLITNYQLLITKSQSDLVIDPTPCLDWGTYYDGGIITQYGLALDKNDNIYISGATQNSSTIATAGAYQTTYGGGSSDVIIAKFNSTGTNLLWGTYYGGAGEDDGFGLAIDSNDNVYVSGLTNSNSGIATPGSYLTTKPDTGSMFNIFVAKFDSSGTNLLWGTYYGKSFGVANNIAIGPDNNVVITGITYGDSGIATPGAYRTSFGYGFVSKFNSANSMLIWGTYNAGEGWDIAFDKKGNIYFTGDETASWFTATPNAYQTTYGGGLMDAFVAKLNSSGSQLLWSTLYGGAGSDMGVAIALDSANNIYATGLTSSLTGIATSGAYQTEYGGGSQDGYIAEFDSTGSTLLWGTYYGGAGSDYSEDIYLDKNDDVYITGLADSSFTGIATAGAYQTTFYGYADPIVAKFNATGSNLLWGTYLGGGSNYGSALAVTANGDIYVSGYGSWDSSLYTPGAYQTYNQTGGNGAIFVVKLGCNIPNGINEITDTVKNTFIVYPNPNNGAFYIERRNRAEKESEETVEIYNMMGQEIASLSSKGGDKIQVNLSGQPSGLYLYRVLKNDGNLITSGKLIIE